MILIQSYEELYYALKVLQILKETDDPFYEKLQEQIRNQVDKLL